MKYLRSSKDLLNKTKRYAWPVVGLATISTFLVATSRQVYSPIGRRVAVKSASIVASSQKTAAKTAPKPSVATPLPSTPKPAPVTPAPAVAAATTPAFVHSGIITTYFYVGEPADADNDYIANNESAWDSQWQLHYGGIDDPNNRSGYFPAAFTPKENPFYFALPYSDIDDSGNRRPTASDCPLYASMKNQPYSWCKNSWIAIRHGGKIAYAQWEDTGPYEENDVAYVFGTAAPENTDGAHAGLDVSPAVKDYLGLQDVDSCDWSFVTAANVPSGPWSQIISTDLGDNTVN